MQLLGQIKFLFLVVKTEDAKYISGELLFQNHSFKILLCSKIVRGLTLAMTIPNVGWMCIITSWGTPQAYT